MCLNFYIQFKTLIELRLYENIIFLTIIEEKLEHPPKYVLPLFCYSKLKMSSNLNLKIFPNKTFSFTIIILLLIFVAIRQN